MQGNPRYFSGNASPEDAYGFNGYPYDSTASAYYNYGAPPPPPPTYSTPAEHHGFPAPINNIEFRPSGACPANFVIFDQTYHSSRVMLHPSLAHEFGPPGYDAYGGGTHAPDAGKSCYRGDEETEDINALLSSDEGEDDDVVSTGRTPGGWGGGSSPDTTCSSQSNSNSRKQSSSSAATGKRDKMKKMVKTLKGIIPGGERMDTPAVLDEAVKYLKSLKVEVKKLGIKQVEHGQF